MIGKFTFTTTLLCGSIALATGGGHHGHHEDDDDRGDRVEICHNHHEIHVDDHAVPAHLAHGDCLGECPCEPVLEPECCNDSDCSDGLFCTGQESCVEGQCVSGTDPCSVGEVCVEDLQQCEYPLPPPECECDDDCSNGSFCDGAEQCIDGECVGATPPCGAGIVCLEDSDQCNELPPPPECECSDDCSDGLFCSGQETCEDGLCITGVLPCATGTQCDEVNDICVSTGEGEGEGEGDAGSEGEGEGDTDDDRQLAGSAFFTCNSSSPSGGIFILACLGALAFVSFRKRIFAPLTIFALAALPAQAEGVSNFQLAPTQTAFLNTQSAETLPDQTFHLQLSSVWDHDPLVFRDLSGNEVAKALENSVNTQLGLSLGLLDQFEVGGSLGAVALNGPVLQNDIVVAATDPRLYGKWKFISVSPGISAALKLSSDLPFGWISSEAQTLSGDPLPTLTPSLLVTFANDFVKVGTEVGHTFRFAPKVLPDSERLGQSLDLGLGVEVVAVPKLLSVTGDVNSRVLYPLNLGQLGSSRLAVPADLNMGAKVFLGEFTVLAGVGTGLTPDFGSPDLRAFAGLSWTPDFSPKQVKIVECPPVAEPTKPIVKDPPTRKPLAVLENDVIVILEPVHFAFDKDVVLPESFLILDDVAQIMKDHKEITLLMVEGHTDSVGSLPYNDNLSARRVASVRGYLIAQGVTANRLDSKGFGERVSLVPNNSPENRAKNRRVEFRVLARAN